MSRILRRPMFRGGSTSKEGIMSVPRKGYEEAGVVQPGYEDEDQDYGEDVQVRDRININSLPDMSGKKTGTGTGTGTGTDKKQPSYSDLLTQEYLGNRSDPMGKFLINFGLNYMSARPRGGKFGALATAADAAKKPTEQLYADQDTDRLLKLKLMTALGKGETAGSFEKKVNFIWQSEQKKPEGLRTFKVKEDVVDYIRKQESERKEQSEETQVNEQAKKIVEKNEAPNFKVAKNKAYFDLFGMDRIPKNESNALANRYYLPPNALTPKPNSTDFTLTDVKNLESTLGKLKEGQTYVEPTRRQVFLYVGNNAFRPLSKF
jgi:hypothetical protein